MPYPCLLIASPACLHACLCNFACNKNLQHTGEAVVALAAAYESIPQSPAKHTKTRSTKHEARQMERDMHMRMHMRMHAHAYAQPRAQLQGRTSRSYISMCTRVQVPAASNRAAAAPGGTESADDGLANPYAADAAHSFLEVCARRDARAMHMRCARACARACDACARACPCVRAVSLGDGRAGRGRAQGGRARQG